MCVTRRRWSESGHTRYLLSILVDGRWLMWRTEDVQFQFDFDISSSSGQFTCETIHPKLLKNCTHKFQKRTKYHIWVAMMFVLFYLFYYYFFFFFWLSFDALLVFGVCWRLCRWRLALHNVYDWQQNHQRHKENGINRLSSAVVGAALLLHWLGCAHLGADYHEKIKNLKSFIVVKH